MSVIYSRKILHFKKKQTVTKVLCSIATIEMSQTPNMAARKFFRVALVLD